jgi:hypothetical protein
MRIAINFHDQHRKIPIGQQGQNLLKRGGRRGCSPRATGRAPLAARRARGQSPQEGSPMSAIAYVGKCHPRCSKAPCQSNQRGCVDLDARHSS